MKQEHDHVSFFLFSSDSDGLFWRQTEVLNELAQEPQFNPVCWGFNPPFKNPFSHEFTGEACVAIRSAGHWDPLVLRDERRGFGYLIDSEPGSDGLWHVSGGFDTHVIADHPDKLVALVDRLALKMGCDYGQIAHEGNPGARMPFDLRLRLPEIPNVSYYGSVCLDHFGRERVMSAPFVNLEWIGNQLIRLHGTRSVFDRIPKQTQLAIRTHLGEEAFMRHPKRRYKNGESPFRE